MVRVAELLVVVLNVRMVELLVVVVEMLIVVVVLVVGCGIGSSACSDVVCSSGELYSCRLAVVKIGYDGIMCKF